MISWGSLSDTAGHGLVVRGVGTAAASTAAGATVEPDLDWADILQPRTRHLRFRGVRPERLLLERLKDLRMPVLVAWGRRDQAKIGRAHV